MIPPTDAVRSLVHALRHGLLQGLGPGTDPYREFGFPYPGPALVQRAPPSVDGVSSSWRRHGLHDASLGTRSGACVATLCTNTHTHLVRTLVHSLRRHHPELPVYVVVVDGLPACRRDFTDLDAVLLRGEGLGLPDFAWLALKYTATELCCAIKPYVVLWLARNTRHDRVLYLDADMHVFARMDTMLTRLEDSDLVVTPHLASMPDDATERMSATPSLGDLSHAGILNAGMFGVALNERSLCLLEQWAKLVVAPGAFQLPGQTDQHALNWISSFADRTCVLRDPSYNVAYWNLTERNLRDRSLDDGEPRTWTVAGRPLVTFHFSGYSLQEPEVLSRHDRRQVPYLQPSLASLLEHYAGLLRANMPGGQATREYGFSRFPSGIRIDATMRRVFKRFEATIRSDIDPWSPAGEEHYARVLLRPRPETGSLLPALFQVLYENRQDLRAAYPDAAVRPEGMLRWAAAHGIDELGWQALYGRHRPVIPQRGAVGALRRLRTQHPGLFERLEEPLGADRQRFIQRLELARVDLAESVRASDVELPVLTPVWVVWKLYRERPDLRASFPDPFRENARALVRWLGTYGVRQDYLPERVALAFARTTEGRPLARIFAFLNSQLALARQWQLALVGERSDEFAQFLLRELSWSRPYSVDDVVAYLWMMEDQPWLGLPLAFELLANIRARPSSHLPEGQRHLVERRLAALAGDARARSGFRQALADYQRRCAGPQRAAEHDYIRAVQAEEDVSVTAVHRRAILPGALEVARASSDSVAPGAARTAVDPTRRRGVNMFGYFRSPIGLGNLSRGLARALETQATEVRPSVLGNTTMAEDLVPDDFVRTFDYRLDTNIIVSYPHFNERLLERLPRFMTRDRRNIVYLAWEQRDGSPRWADVYGGFDDVWALSSFAATALSRWVGRDVKPIPGVLELERFPPAAAKERVGLDPDRFTFLYVFDATSSMERKNPEGALAAYQRAFSGADPVEMVLKVTNPRGPETRDRLRRLLRAADASRPRVRVLLEPHTYRQTLELISAADCYVSLHRAEGFGYTCAEAMAYGKPVIATRYSGNLDFMGDENSLLVDCDEVEVRRGEGPFLPGSIWAEPRLGHAAEQMRQAFARRDHCRALGRRARGDIHRQLSAEAVGRLAAAALYGDPDSRARCSR